MAYSNMVFKVGDFENETVGTVPTGWTVLQEDGGGPVEVTDTYVVKGTKSFQVTDLGAGSSVAQTDYNNEDIVFTMENYEMTEQGTHAHFHVMGVDNTATELSTALIWDWLFTTTSTNPASATWDIWFETQITSFDLEGAPAPTNNVGSTNFADVRDIEIRNPTTSMELLIDGSSIHDTGNGYSASYFRFRNDDSRVSVDNEGAFFDYIFEQGNRIGQGTHADNYVFGQSGAFDDGGNSTLTFISGSPTRIET